MEQTQVESSDYLVTELDNWDSRLKESFENYDGTVNYNKTLQTLDLHDQDLSTLDLDKILEAYKSIANRDYLTRQILDHELKTYTPLEKVNEYEKVVELLNNYLTRYQPMLCGAIFEDDGWCTNSAESIFFNVTDETTILFNTVKRKLQNDKFLLSFMNNVVELMKRSVDGFDVSYKIIDDKKKNVCWTLFKIKKLTN